MFKQIEKAIADIRQLNPLILCLTNYVTMDFVANSLLAIGASPIISECEEDLEELVKISNAVYINIGTINNEFIEYFTLATRLAKKHGKSVIFDPVASGATKLRTKLSRDLLLRSEIIRGNASEIISLSDNSTHTHGVDSSNTTEQAKNTARMLAKNHNVIIVVSGEKDFITNGLRESDLCFGSSLMPLVTGMGCALTATIAAFKSVISDKFEAAKYATAYFGLCGNLTATQAFSPGSFRTCFIDNLYKSDIKAMRIFNEV